ncbi:hypothetical protein HNP84_009356 [Thermocatellispora tengchongensis]|uniref:Cholesterol esterase n=1 Tax=Thermocatellispora tengchongensis TaxID=1073253 RepID=A0A840PKG7_9ACTN|nr:DUF6230 family protein [Thermocatellispora tengchongensis]MBB5139592.1 hypothetical protein [Thermocatellispora tengchongensis]
MAGRAGMASASGGTAWRRFALALVPALTAAAVLAAVTGEGGVAASFSVSGQRFKVSADRLVGQGFAQYGDVVVTADGGRRPVLMSMIGRATLTGLCQSVLMPTPVGRVTFLLRAGRDGRPVEATNLVIDLHQLSGDAAFDDIEIGRDASTLDTPPGLAGRPGQVGQQAATVRISGLRQTAYAVNAGTFRLNGLRLSIERGDRECF